ncbi:MAG TPA: hypothetical protein VJI74_03190 [Candidatus Paceibacterota bacterium]
MSKIMRAAHFTLCNKCKLEGYIVCADGTVTYPFATKEKGLSVLNRLIIKGKITPGEGLAVQAKIQASPLLENRPTLDEVLEETLRQIKWWEPTICVRTVTAHLADRMAAQMGNDPLSKTQSERNVPHRTLH